MITTLHPENQEQLYKLAKRLRAIIATARAAQTIDEAQIKAHDAAKRALRTMPVTNDDKALINLTHDIIWCAYDAVTLEQADRRAEALTWLDRHEKQLSEMLG